jgi:hypothetical protein
MPIRPAYNPDQFRGIYADPSTLASALPNSTTGDYAYVVSTGSHWYWDYNTTAWKEWAGGGGGGGDVFGPAGATDEAIARFNTATGKLIQDSLVLIDNAGSISLPASQTVDGRDLSVDGSKLDGIEAGATADQSAIQVPFTPYGDIASTDVQNAIEELDDEKAALVHGHLDDQVFHEVIGSPTYETIKDLINLLNSSILLSGGIVTENSALNGTVDIAAAKAMIKKTDSDIGDITLFDVSSSIGVAVSDGYNYVNIDYNSGTPQFIITTSKPNDTTIFTIATVYKITGDHHIYIVNNISEFTNFQDKVNHAIYESFGLLRAFGLVTTESGTEDLYPVMTVGEMYAGIIEIEIPAIDTSYEHDITGGGSGGTISANDTIILDSGVGDVTAEYTHGQTIRLSTSSNGNDGAYHVESTSWDGSNTTIIIEETTLNTGNDTGHIHPHPFCYWYNDGSWIKVEGQGTIDNIQYNDFGTGLTDLTAQRYGVHWVYVSTSGIMHIIYGQGDYTLSQSEDAPVPSTVPDIIDKTCLLIAKIRVQKSAANWFDVFYPWSTVFAATGATVHNDLGGLNVGDYLHLTAAEYASLGDVVGPGSSIDNYLARFDGITGKLIQVGSAILDDAGLLTIGALNTINNITVGGTVDGRDVATDGAKLDTIATNANNYSHPNHSGEVTSVGDGATTIVNRAVTNSKLANMVEDAIKGREHGTGTGVPVDLTPVQVRAILRETWTVLTYSASITPNALLASRFELILTGDTTINVPTNLTEGQVIVYRIRQDGTGGYTVTWHSDYRTGQIPNIVVSDGADETTYVICIYEGVLKCQPVQWQFTGKQQEERIGMLKLISIALLILL